MSFQEKLQAVDAFIVGANSDHGGAHQGQVTEVIPVESTNVGEVIDLFVLGKVYGSLVVSQANCLCRLEANGLHLGVRSQGQKGSAQCKIPCHLHFCLLLA